VAGSCSQSRQSMAEPPKSACSAQQFFNKARRLSLKEEEPNIKGPEIAKRIADEWREMTVEDRAPYQQQAAADKVRFEAEIAEAGSTAEKPAGPKKPRPPFHFFSEATRAELLESNPDIQISMLTTLIGEEWKKLSKEARAPYERQAADDTERYNAEMAELKAAEKKRKADEAGSSGAAEDAGDDDDDDDDSPAALKKKNKALTAKVAQLEKANAKLQKQVETLTGKASKSSGKASEAAADEEADAPKKGKAKAKGGGSSEGPSEDPAHYLAWTKKVLGAKGEKVEPEMLKILASKGPKGLAKLLLKRYQAEHGL